MFAPSSRPQHRHGDGGLRSMQAAVLGGDVPHGSDSSPALLPSGRSGLSRSGFASGTTLGRGGGAIGLPRVRAIKTPMSRISSGSWMTTRSSDSLGVGPSEMWMNRGNRAFYSARALGTGSRGLSDTPGVLLAGRVWGGVQ